MGGNDGTDITSHEARVARGQRLVLEDHPDVLFYLSDCEEGVYMYHKSDDGDTTLWLSHTCMRRMFEWYADRRGSLFTESESETKTVSTTDSDQS